MKRAILLADFHCGHRSGLTPPEWQRDRYGDAPREAWEWYAGKQRQLRPVHAVIGLGDFIDGRGDRQGSIEQITTDRREQAEMARVCLSGWDAEKYALVRGTPYHTGQDEDWEDDICGKLDAHIADRLTVDIDGVTFDAKHKVGRSTIPHGRGTPLARAALWNELLANEERIPLADIIARAHVHYFTCIGGIRKGRPWWAMSLPALQLPSSRYGSRECEGIVHFGFIVFDIDEGRYSWRVEAAELQNVKAPVLSL